MAELQVLLSAAAVEQDRAEDHLHQQWFVHERADHGSRRPPVALLSELVVVGDFANEPVETVHLSGEMTADLRP